MLDRVARQVKREVFWYGSISTASGKWPCEIVLFSTWLWKKNSWTLHGEGSRLQVLDMFVLGQLGVHQKKTARRHSRQSLKFFQILQPLLGACLLLDLTCAFTVLSWAPQTCHGARLTVSGTKTMSHRLRLRRRRGDADRKRPSCSVSVTTEHQSPAPQNVAGAILNIAIPDWHWPIVWHQHPVGQFGSGGSKQPTTNWQAMSPQSENQSVDQRYANSVVVVVWVAEMSETKWWDTRFQFDTEWLLWNVNLPAKRNQAHARMPKICPWKERVKIRKHDKKTPKWSVSLCLGHPTPSPPPMEKKELDTHPHWCIGCWCSCI